MKEVAVKSLLPVRVAIAAVIIDRSLNVREDQGYDVENLITDLAARGQMDPVTLERMTDGTYRPIKGFRRCTAIQEAAKRGIVDPLTGKPFDTVIAIVRENLTMRERLALLIDHTHKGLNSVELFYALEKLFKAGYTEKDSVDMTRDLLEMHYPPSRKIEPPTPENYLAYYRGVTQTVKLAAMGPVVLRDSWVKKLKKEQTWPVKKDMERLSKLGQKEIADDKDLRYNRENPGPLFLKEWETYVAKQQEAIANGETRAKSDAMMTNDGVNKLFMASESLILKIACNVVLRKNEPETWANLDAYLAAYEKSLTDEQLNELRAVCGLGAVPTDTEATNA